MAINPVGISHLLLIEKSVLRTKKFQNEVVRCEKVDFDANFR